MNNIIDKIIAGRDLSKKNHKASVSRILESLIMEVKYEICNATTKFINTTYGGERLINEDDTISLDHVIKKTGLKQGEIYGKMKTNDFPRNIKIVGAKFSKKGWDKSEVDEWMKNQSEITEEEAWVEKQKEPTADEIEIKEMADKMVEDAYKLDKS